MSYLLILGPALLAMLFGSWWGISLMSAGMFIDGIEGLIFAGLLPTAAFVLGYCLVGLPLEAFVSKFWLTKFW